MMNVFLQIMPHQSVGTIFVLLQSRMLAPFRFGKGLPNFVGKKLLARLYHRTDERFFIIRKTRIFLVHLVHI